MAVNTRAVRGTGLFLLMLLVVVGVVVTLLIHHLHKNQPDPRETAPTLSPREQVEFEAGDLFRDLHDRQLKDLESSGPFQDGYGQVPIDTAVHWMARTQSTEMPR